MACASVRIFAVAWLLDAPQFQVGVAPRAHEENRVVGARSVALTMHGNTFSGRWHFWPLCLSGCVKLLSESW